MQVRPGPALEGDLESERRKIVKLFNIICLSIISHAGRGGARGSVCCTQLELLWLKKEARSSSDISETSPGDRKTLLFAALASLAIMVILQPNQIIQEHCNATA